MRRSLHETRLIAVVILASILMLMLASPARADLSDEQRRAILDQGLSSYDTGMALRRADPAAATVAFHEAADRFEQLVRDGVDSAAVHYDLGNARARLGDWGWAILHYRRAQLRSPGDDRIARNLEYARSQRADQLQQTGRRELLDAVLGWHRRTSVQTRVWVFSLAYLPFWGLVLGRIMRGWRIRWPAIGLGILWLALGASLVIDLAAPAGSQDGVLVRDDVTIRKGNGDGFEAQFREPLNQGVEFELIEQRGDWLHIELPDGGRGWVRATQAALIS